MSARIGAGTYAERIGRAQEAVGRAGHAALLLGVGPELEWLTGYDTSGHERITLLVLPARGRPTLVLPRLELSAALAAPGPGADLVATAPWQETDDPYAHVTAALGPVAPGAHLLVSDSLKATFLLRLQAALPAARWSVASALVSPLRQVKDADEIALLRAAAAAADRTVGAILAGRLVGRTEAEVAKEVRDRLVAEGHDTAEFWIVASGPASASPHHDAAGAEIRAGAPLLLDIGGRLGGYCSDITRTAWVAGPEGIAPDDGFRAIHALVERAQAAGRAAVRPGVSFASLDAAARKVIEDAGHGPHFFHRLGHGIGLEVHEDPYVVETNAQLLVPGNTFSIEPGVYLEGVHGVRIEDQVLCTATGGESLNAFARELLVVSGI